MSEQNNIPPQQQNDPSFQQPAQQPFQQPFDHQTQQQWQQPIQQPFDQQQWQQPQQAQQPFQQQWQQPYANPYGRPAPNGQPAQPSKMPTIALVCGIVAIVFSLCIFIGIVQTVVGIVLGSLGIVAGVVAIVLAVLAMRKSPNRKATAGLVCGIVAVVLSAILIPTSLMAIFPAAQGAMKGSSSKSHKAALADVIDGEIIKDDEVATITLGKMEIDEDGNLIINYKMTNNINDSGVEITLKDKTGSAWELNGQKVECSCLAWAKSGKTVENTIIIPASYIDFDDVDEVESLSGLLIYDLSPGHIEGEVHVDLYAR